MKLCTLVCVLCSVLLSLPQAAYGRKNVLLLMADDLRPSISPYETRQDTPSFFDPKMITPNLNALAKKSMVMKKAYTQFSECSPSRSSFLTGRRPDTTHVYDLRTFFREVGGNFTTIPKYFKEHGYTSIGVGKTFHYFLNINLDDMSSYDDVFHAPDFCYWQSYNASWMAVGDEQLEQHPLQDTQIAEYAVNALHNLAQDPQQPWFLAVGLHKPHWPYTFPAHFLDLYPEEEIEAPDNLWQPVHMPEIAFALNSYMFQFKDLQQYAYTEADNHTFPADVVKVMKRAYYAATSHSDYLLGTVMQALEESGQADNTIVIFLSDHGYHLGENCEWDKLTNYEIAQRVPLMIHTPGMTEGGQTEQPVELVDLFPTLVDLAELPQLPLCPEDSADVVYCREGSSMLPLLQGSSDDTERPWKRGVFSQMHRKQDNKQYMGYSVLVGDIRYTEWVRFLGEPLYQPLWAENIGTELYDHGIDPEENYNHANEEEYAEVQQKLADILHAGWRAALPVEDPRDSSKAVRAPWTPTPLTNPVPCPNGP